MPSETPKRLVLYEVKLLRNLKQETSNKTDQASMRTLFFQCRLQATSGTASI
jgi:hypothetical protein